jgi:hypothetical protein
MKARVKQNKNFLLFVGVLFFVMLLYGYSLLRKNYIENDCVYVIGNIYSIESNADAISYKFVYIYRGIKHFDGITSLDTRRQDKLILLKISRRKPDLWIHIEEDMPECITLKPNFNIAWDFIPTCEVVHSK